MKLLLAKPEFQEEQARQRLQALLREFTESLDCNP
jgi:hypothetical protein